MNHLENPQYENMRKRRLLNKICAILSLILLFTGCMGTYCQYYDRNSILTITNKDSSVTYGRLIDITRKDSIIYYSFTNDRMQYTRNYDKAKAEIIMHIYHYNPTSYLARRTLPDVYPCPLWGFPYLASCCRSLDA